jgi:hypothetical protein
MQEEIRDVDLHGTNFAAGAAKGRSEGQLPRLADAGELRSD